MPVGSGAGAATADLERLRAQLAAHDEDQGQVMNFDDFLRASEAPPPPLQPPADAEAAATRAAQPFSSPASFIPPPNAFAGTVYSYFCTALSFLTSRGYTSTPESGSSTFISVFSIAYIILYYIQYMH